MSKKDKPNPIFRVISNIWSQQHQQYFEPGETVSFDLTADNAPNVDLLIVKGVIEVVTEVVSETEAENGANSPDSPAS